jgi:N-acyl-D-amino-acid deacylase
LRAGAVGLSTSRSQNHETADDRPVASRIGTWEEYRRLVLTMSAMGGGLVEIAPDTGIGSKDPEIQSKVLSQIEELNLTSGCTFSFGLGGAGWREKIKMIDGTAAAGGRMYGQTHSRGIFVILSFETRLPFDGLAEWSRVRALPLEEQRKILTDPESRKRLVDEALHGDYGRAIGLESPAPNYHTIFVMDQALPPNPSVADLAAARGVSPVDLMIDLGLASDFNQLFAQRLGDSETPEDDLVEMLKHPRTVMTFSDSGAHVSQISDASIQTHLLAYWVRERQLFSLEEAIRMVTLSPARVFGFTDRGLIREGMIADLNVFDPATIAPAMPKVVHDLPGGARRLDQRSVGFRATVVGGEVLFDNGEHTGAYPGRLVRGPLSRV